MNPDEQFDCRVFFGFWLLRIFFSPLKNISGWKFSLTAPPRWYHKQTSVPNVGNTVGKGSNALKWAPEDWGLAPKAIWLLHIIFYSPLKNMSGQKFSHAAPLRWYHKQTSIPDVGLTVGKGFIASEWALEDGRRPESQFDCRVFCWILPLKIWWTEI